MRALDEEEERTIARLGIVVFTAEDVHRLGAPTVARSCLRHLAAAGCRELHLSFDVDALDPEYAPATGTPCSGGLTQGQGAALCREIAASGQLSSMDIVEFNPALLGADERRETALAALSLATAATAAGLAHGAPADDESGFGLGALVWG